MTTQTEADTAAQATARALTIREAVIEGIREEMLRDAAVVMIGQDIGKFGGPLQCAAGLYDQFGAKRVVETPICESSMTSLALGAAAMGLRPVVDIMFSDMLPLAAVPLVQTAGYYRYYTAERGQVPVVVRTRGGDGPYRAHPQNYEAQFAHSPGLVIVQPSNPRDAKGMIKSAIRSDDPVIFMENIFLYNAFKDDVGAEPDALVPLRQADVIRPGSDATLVVYGRAVRTGLQAAEQLQAERGATVEVIDLRTLAPWDEETLTASVRKTGRLVVAHEAWTNGGLGAEIVARLTDRCWAQLRARPVRAGAPAIPIPWAPPLRDATLPLTGRILDALRLIFDSDS